MVFKIAAQLSVSALAVFGAYALFRFLVTARFLPEKSGLCIKVDASISLSALPQLLYHARLMANCIAGGRVVCLVERGVDEGVIAYLKSENIPYYQI